LKFLRVISNLLRFDRTDWTAVALCLFAAAVFWIFNALNKDHSANLSLPLEVQYDEVRYAAADHIPPQLTVNVTGPGWELLRKSLGQKVPVISIPLERPTDVRYIPGSTLARQVISQLGSLQLNYVALDTLRLSIEPRVSRTLKITADISRVTFRNNLGRVSPVELMPDSIKLEGPDSYINSLPDSLIVEAPARRVSGHYRESLEVRLDKNEFIRRDPPVAEVMFEVGPVVEISKQLPLPLPRTAGLQADRDSLRVRLLIPGREQERFGEDFAAIIATLPEINIQRGDTIHLLPRLQGVPSYATVLYLDSVEVRRRLPE